jgi:hypothetical protein
MFPQRSRFAPALLPKLEPMMFLVSRKPAGNFLFDYIGSEIRNYILRDFETAHYLDLLSQKEREAMEDHFTLLTGRGCGGYLRRRVARADGSVVEGAHYVLPLASHDGVPRYVAGIVEVYSVKRGSFLNRFRPRGKILEEAYLDLGNGTPPGKAEMPILPEELAVKVS